MPEFRGTRRVILPDYDMGLARALVAGCDVWLNNPIRPHEACGTSGMKAAMNGALNLSVLDGWWDEAPTAGDGLRDRHCERLRHRRPGGGLALPGARERRCSRSSRRGTSAGLPAGWVEKMIQSASRIGRHFSSERMVTEYLELCYVPAAERKVALLEDARDRSRAVGVVPYRE